MSSKESQFDYNDRYGIKPANAWIRYATLFALIGGAWIVWAGLHHANPAIRTDLISFTTTDARNPVIRYSVQRQNEKQEVTCTLTARDIDKNIVGQIDDAIPAGSTYLERSVTIPTRADAVNVGIARCRIL
jgi:Domain of unknown function (DUF4307)